MSQRSMREELLTRRDAILRVSALLGGTAWVGQSALLAGCVGNRSLRAADTDSLFSAEDVVWLDEVADTILPETGTPGAKAAGVGRFIAIAVTDMYDAEEQATFLAGMQRLEQECRDAYGVGIVAAEPTQRLDLLRRVDAEQFEHAKVYGPDGPAHYFRMMKELTLFGYFTSEIGYTQAMRYVETPGRFDPCVAYAPGERAWAPHA